MRSLTSAFIIHFLKSKGQIFLNSPNIFGGLHHDKASGYTPATVNCFCLLFSQDELKRASEINKREKEMNRKLTVKADIDVAHNYSTQTLNSTELAKEKLRQILAKVSMVLIESADKILILMEYA